MEKNTIIEKVCYTDLVFERVNKKLSKTMTQNEIKFLVLAILNDNRSQFEKIGKNYEEYYKITYIKNVSVSLLVFALLLSCQKSLMVVEPTLVS